MPKVAELLKKMSGIGGAPSTADVCAQLKVFASEFGATAVLAVANEQVGDTMFPKLLCGDASSVPALTAGMHELKGDPAFVRAQSSSNAFVPSDVEGHNGPFSRLLETMAAGGEALVVPVGEGPNARGFVVFAGSKLALTPFARAILFIAAYAALTQAFGLAKQPVSGPAKKANSLTEREAECLRWLSVGKSDGEISSILGISPRTVRFHIDNAKVKLGAATRIQAVAKALRDQAIAA